MLCSAWLGTAWRCFALHCIALPGTPARARAPRKAKGLPACPPARLPLCGGPAEPRLASRGGGLPGPGPRRQGDPHPSRKALGPSASPPLRGWGVGVPGGGGGPAACHTGAADLAGTTRPSQASPPSHPTPGWAACCLRASGAASDSLDWAGRHEARRKLPSGAREVVGGVCGFGPLSTRRDLSSQTPSAPTLLFIFGCLSPQMPFVLTLPSTSWPLHPPTPPPPRRNLRNRGGGGLVL